MENNDQVLTKIKDWLDLNSDKSPLSAPLEYQGDEHFIWAAGWNSCIERLKEFLINIEEKANETEPH